MAGELTIHHVLHDFPQLFEFLHMFVFLLAHVIGSLFRFLMAITIADNCYNQRSVQ
jgi:hypothetical protein